MGRISNKSIMIARKVNLEMYLKSKGIILKKVGNGSRYEHPEHDSLKFKDNVYFWNSKSDKGNSLDYATKHLGMDFKTAVNDLCSFSGRVIENEEIEEKEFSINDTEITKDIRRSIAYLNKTRGIDNKFIQLFINMQLISQTKEKNNIAFLIKDENLETVGIELNTTLSNKRFKGLAENSKYGYGFNIRSGNEPKSILYFESAIDLISFMQYIGYEKSLEKLNSTMFVSMAGLKENVIKHNQKMYNNPSIFICIDNPEFEKKTKNGSKASENFVNYLNEKDYQFKSLVSPNCKDWNELINLNQDSSKESI